MISLGIVGAENSHSHSIAKVCNIERRVPMRASYIWGETASLAAASREKGNIPCLVKDWRELLGKVDGVMIAHRDGGRHYEVAKFFIEHKVPAFIDKPLTTNLGEARRLLSLAAQNRTPVCSFSVVPLHPAFKKGLSRMEEKGLVQAVNSSGPIDVDSPFGGIYFYGIHQIDSIVEIMGTGAESALLQRNGKNCVATISFADGAIATMNGFARGPFHWRVFTEEDILTISNEREWNAHLAAAKIIHRMIRFGEVPWSQSRMLAPIAILDALQKSLTTGRKQRVTQV